MHRNGRAKLATTLGAAAVLVATAATQTAGGQSPAAGRPATPIRHLVVIFDENNSFDHYFGTYPHAANTDGTPFHANPGTPRVNGLRQHRLLTHNPNRLPDGSPANPQRLGPDQAVTCDQDHGYT